MDNQTLDILRTKYDAIEVVPYQDLRRNSQEVVVRKLTFGEYLFANKYAFNIAPPDKPPQYEIDPEVGYKLFQDIIVYPEDFDHKKAPAGLIIKVVSAAMSLCGMESDSNVRNMYINSIRNAHSVLGLLSQRILAAYGVQGYQLIKDLPEEEVMDLLVFSEVITDQLGEFAKIARIGGLPWGKPKGKKPPTIDVNALLGVPEAENAQQNNTKRDASTDRIIKYYKSLNMTDAEIERALNFRQQSTQFNGMQDLFENADKIDLNNTSDQALKSMNMSASEYAQAKKDGKIMSFEESQNKAIEVNKIALAEQIRQDKERFGNKHTQGKNFKGDIKELLKTVKTEIKKMDL